MSLIQPAPATGQQRLTQAIDEFRQQLTPADRTTLSQTLQPDVVAVTEFTSQFNKNSNLKKKQLGDKLQPFLQFIQSLGDIVNIYIQTEPKIAALVWGSVKLVVQISSNYFDYFVKISDLFVKIAHLCPTIERIGQLFQNSIKLQDAVLEFYAIIVEFCSRAFVFLRQPGLKQFAKSIWKPFKVQFQAFEEELVDQRQRINDEVLIASEIAAHQAAQQALIYQKHGYAHRLFEVDQWAQQTNWQLQQHALIKAGSESLTYRVMILSLLMQLAVLNQPLEASLLSKLEEIYDNKQIPPRLREIEALLTQFALLLGDVYIVMDGIDEFSTNDKLELLLFLKRLLQAKPDYLKILLSSRSDVDTPRILDITHHIPMTAETHRPDLESYINDELEDKCPNLALYPTQLKDEIKSTLLKGADGMFPWVHFQIQDIRNASSSKKIKKLLQSLPRGLHNTYARIVSRIIAEKDSSEAIMVFKWLSACLRPLKIMEIRDAISIRVEDTQYYQIRERHSDDFQSTINNCCYLVILNHRDQTVQYAHSTVAKYLETNFEVLFEKEIGRTISRSVFETRVSLLCATYLKLGDYHAQIAPRPIQKKQSAIQSPVDWIPGILSAALTPSVINFLQSVFKYQTNRHIRVQEVSINKIVDSLLSPAKSWDEYASLFPFFDYINTHWLDHFRFEHLTEEKTRLDCLEVLRELLYDCNFPFRYLPLMDGNEKPDAGSLICWACKQDHLPLFLVIEAEPGCSPISTPFGLVHRYLLDISPYNLVVISVDYGSTNVLEYIARNWLSKESRLWLERSKGSYIETNRRGQEFLQIWNLILDENSSSNRIPLAIAAGLGHTSIIQALLPVYLYTEAVARQEWGTGQMKSETRASRSRWFQVSVEEAVKNGQLEVIKLFLEEDGYGRRPFDSTTAIIQQNLLLLPTFWKNISLLAIEEQKMEIMEFFSQLGAYDDMPTTCADDDSMASRLSAYIAGDGQIAIHFSTSQNAVS
ncbi:hypothetical protein H072_6496, partial [Dactylellina haptotyla CBS 200.50]